MKEELEKVSKILKRGIKGKIQDDPSELDPLGILNLGGNPSAGDPLGIGPGQMTTTPSMIGQ
jgi:hypothetical protein